MTRERSPAQLYALLFGIVLLVVGIVGFIADSSFATGSDVEGSDLIVFEVNYVESDAPAGVTLVQWRRSRLGPTRAAGSAG